MALCLIIVLFALPSLPVVRADQTSTDTQQSGECEGFAKYKLTIETHWSVENFPKVYPRYRPPAQWSHAIGRSHSQAYKLFAKNEPVSEVFAAWLKDPSSKRMMDQAQGFGGIFDEFVSPRIRRGEGMSATYLFLNGKHDKVSFAAKMIPSPDWFIGISGVKLCEDGHWINSTSHSLPPLDGGIQKGLSYTSPDWPEIVKKPVSEITHTSQRFHSAALHYPRLRRLPVLARARLTRSNTDSPDADLSRASTDCAMSPWTRWGRCSRTCGVGTRTRNREIVRQPSGDGAQCPREVDSAVCGGVSNCFRRGTGGIPRFNRTRQNIGGSNVFGIP